MLCLIIYWQCEHHSWFWKMGPFTPRPKIVERALSQGGLQMEHHSKRQNVRVSIISSAWCLVFQIVPEWNKNSTYVWLCDIMYVYIKTNTYIHTCAACINNIDPPHSKETKRQRMSSGETAFHVTRWAHHAFQLSEKPSAKGAWCFAIKLTWKEWSLDASNEQSSSSLPFKTRWMMLSWLCKLALATFNL